MRVVDEYITNLQKSIERESNRVVRLNHSIQDVIYKPKNDSFIDLANYMIYLLHLSYTYKLDSLDIKFRLEKADWLELYKSHQDNFNKTYLQVKTKLLEFVDLSQLNVSISDFPGILFEIETKDRRCLLEAYIKPTKIEPSEQHNDFVDPFENLQSDLQEYEASSHIYDRHGNELFSDIGTLNNMISLIKSYLSHEIVVYKIRTNVSSTMPFSVMMNDLVPCRV